MRPRHSAMGRTVAVLVAVALIASGTVGYVVFTSLSGSPRSPISTSSRSSSGSSSSFSPRSSKPSYSSGQPCLNLSVVYMRLGYPTVTYSSYSPYLPSKPNYTMEYQTGGVDFQVEFDADGGIC